MISHFTSSVPADERRALQAEAAFQKIADEIEGNQRTMMTHENVKALFAAIHAEIDNTVEPCVGLSASRHVEGDKITWDICFGVDHSMTVICSENDYTAVVSEIVAKTIIQCWEAEWDE